MAPNSLTTKTTAAISKNAAKTNRSARSGTRFTRLAPKNAPGMEPAAVAIPTR